MKRRKHYCATCDKWTDHRTGCHVDTFDVTAHVQAHIGRLALTVDELLWEDEMRRADQ